jgi:hypothetical protein
VPVAHAEGFAGPFAEGQPVTRQLREPFADEVT